MKKLVEISVIVKKDWFEQGEIKRTVSLPERFVDYVRVGDGVPVRLLVGHIIPIFKITGKLTNKTKMACHDAAKNICNLDPSVDYTEALQTTYIDWISKLEWEVTCRKWVYTSIHDEDLLLEITIRPKKSM